METDDKILAKISFVNSKFIFCGYDIENQRRVWIGPLQGRLQMPARAALFGIFPAEWYVTAKTFPQGKLLAITARSSVQQTLHIILPGSGG